MIGFQFIQSTAALFSIAFIADLLQERFPSFLLNRKNLFTGVKYGFIALAGMLSPLVISEGVQYDIRGPLITLAGLFGGIVGAIVAAIGPLVFRLHLGGAGLPAGVLSVLMAVVTGVALYELYTKKLHRYPTWKELIAVGILCNLTTLMWTYLLPSAVKRQVLIENGTIILFVYMISTVVFGVLELRNIGQRKNKQRLQDNQHLMATAQEIGHFGFGLLDLRKNTIQVSDYLHNITKGDSRPIVVSTDEFFKDYVSDFSKNRLREFFQMLREGSSPEPTEIEIVSVNGQSNFWAHFVGWLDQKQKMMAVLIFQNVSDKTSLFEQMSHAARLATLGETATSIGHEIINPLSAARLSTERLEGNIIAGKGNDPSSLVLIQKIESRLAAITSLVRSISMFARVESSPKQPVSIHDVVYQTIELFKEINGANAPSIELDLGASDDVVMGRDLHFQQVLLNLLNNALHALRGIAKPSLKIVSDSFDGTVRISVIDNGAGISKELKEKIFRPFFTTKDPGKGTGLGLSIVEAIMRDVGGKIDVDSVPNQMTAFHLQFPIYRA